MPLCLCVCYIVPILCRCGVLCIRYVMRMLYCIDSRPMWGFVYLLCYVYVIFNGFYAVVGFCVSVLLFVCYSVSILCRWGVLCISYVIYIYIFYIVSILCRCGVLCIRYIVCMLRCIDSMPMWGFVYPLCYLYVILYPVYAAAGFCVSVMLVVYYIVSIICRCGDLCIR